jgi:hypothetical protein
MRTFRLRQFALRRPLVPLGKGNRAMVPEPSAFVVRPSRTIKGAARVTKKRLTWEASRSPGVKGYRVYWEHGKRVDYDSSFADLEDVTVLVLPDDIPSFPLVAGQMEIGITAVSRSGSESDMRVLSVLVDFTRPDVPLNVSLEDVERER